MSNKEKLTEISVEIIVTGLVQGVGFRPFVYRIAMNNNLRGWVINTNENVRISLSGTQEQIKNFMYSLEYQSPPAAVIESVVLKEVEYIAYTSFSIKSSHNISDDITEISPDIAVCKDCLEDIKCTGNRFDYAFVNCTNCGPRFTIIQDLPYDRAKTSMKDFNMCPDCRKEYEDVMDRRFHAQPTACKVCGPQYQMYKNGKLSDIQEELIPSETADIINKGGIVLIKGLGGMNLACDAFNESSIKKLREIKNREGKPFAVMFSDIEAVKKYASITAIEEQTLTSWKRPIVLLQKKRIQPQLPLAYSLNTGLNLLGIMLPYLPFHYLLFNYLKTSAIVLTSGNFSSEPILIENSVALEEFSFLVDAVVLHNRDIYNRTDDSVVRIIADKERIFRRSRGYVPAPIRTKVNTDGILAFGAELTNCFCVGKGQKAFLSQHIGDLQGIETTIFYEETLQQFIQLFRIKPDLLAVDMHPLYISTKAATNFSNLSVVQVQHHHAHIASCMFEHGLDEKVIGVAFDGTGYGTDGHSWGSEFILADLNDFTRISHFEYLPMPGGDKASEEPWRMAVSYLYKVYGKSFLNLKIPFVQKLDTDSTDMILHMIDKKINSPLTSGAGRLFDAVSAILGLVTKAAFQAEGPMRLESLIQENITERYEVNSGDRIDFGPCIKGIVEDLLKGTDTAIISAKFHNTVIFVIFDRVNVIGLRENINKVVLSGGVFQNKYLLEVCIKILEQNNFKVYSQLSVPSNDGGIALGQLAVASKRRELKCV